MKRTPLLLKGLIFLVALTTLSMVSVFATAAGSKAQEARYNKSVMHVTIALTGKGIVATPASLKPGNHLLTIKNNTKDSRGIEMIGIDKAGSPTVRYTKILKPGKSEAFRWYFAEGNTVYVRDIMSCSHDKMNCTVVGFGQMRKAIHVR